jgi:hypothetical protein
MEKNILNEEVMEINENHDTKDMMYYGHLIGSKLSGKIIKMVDEMAYANIGEDFKQSIIDNPDTFFGFYKSVLDGVMNPLYEKMGDSYNTKAGAAPDEYGFSKTDSIDDEFYSREEEINYGVEDDERPVPDEMNEAIQKIKSDFKRFL